MKKHAKKKLTKQQLMPTIAEMMSNAVLAEELASQLEKVEKVFQDLDTIIHVHLMTIRELSKKTTTENKGDRLLLLKSVKEMAYEGYIARRLSHFTDIFKYMDQLEQVLLMDECVRQHLSDLSDKLGNPTVEEAKRRMREIEEELGRTPEQMLEDYKNMQKIPEGN